MKEIKTWNDRDIEHKFIDYMKKQNLKNDQVDQIAPSFIQNIRFPEYDFSNRVCIKYLFSKLEIRLD